MHYIKDKKYENHVVNNVKQRVRSITNKKVYKNGAYSSDLTEKKKIQLIRCLYLFISRNIIIFQSYKFRPFITTLCRKSNEYINHINKILKTKKLDQHYKWYLMCCIKNFKKPCNYLLNYFNQVNLVLNKIFCKDICYSIRQYL